MDKKKKDLKLLVVLCVTAVVGLINILLNGNKELIFSYVACMCMISVLYFNYSLCKWENRWRNYWREKTPGTGEPTEWWLTISKIGEWCTFVLGLILALIPKF